MVLRAARPIFIPSTSTQARQKLFESQPSRPTHLSEGIRKMLMQTETPQSGGTTNAQSEQEVMIRHGITRVPADYFLYRQYRYTQLKDAVAQAERDQSTVS